MIIGKFTLQGDYTGQIMHRAIPSRRRVPAPAAVLLRQRATAVIINDGAVHDNATCMLQTVSAYLRSIDQSARSSSPSRAIYA